MKSYRNSVRTIEEQIKKIAEVFRLDPNQALKFAERLPSLMKKDRDLYRGWYAFPKISAVALKNFSSIINPSIQYCRAVDFVDLQLKHRRVFINELQDSLDHDHFVQTHRTSYLMEEIQKHQPGSIIIVECQLGMINRFASVQNARKSFKENEFGLNSFQVLCILITHPEFLDNKNNLGVDCAGDQFSPINEDRLFSYVPGVCINKGEVKLIKRHITDISDRFGSATGFVQKN